MIRLLRRLMRSSRLPLFALSFLLLFSPFGSAQQTGTLAPLVQNYVRVNAPKVVLEHVRVIDGTGRAPQQDENIVIERGKITSVEASSDVPATQSVTVLDLRGYTVMPGIVGMHNHLFYIARPNFKADRSWDEPLLVPQMTFSAPRLYLAAGVTTMRTTGSVETYADLNLKRKIDEGKLPGPHIDVRGHISKVRTVSRSRCTSLVAQTKRGRW
jgi:imidazolonepropionase-like amidohydrolase